MVGQNCLFNVYLLHPEAYVDRIECQYNIKAKRYPFAIDLKTHVIHDLTLIPNFQL